MSIIKVKVGGIEREIRAEIGLALKIERRTNQGLIALGQRFSSATASLSEAIAVIALALDHSGVAGVTEDSVAEYAARDGIVATVLTAGRIVDAFFVVEKAKPGRKGGEAPLATSGQ